MPLSSSRAGPGVDVGRDRVELGLRALHPPFCLDQGPVGVLAVELDAALNRRRKKLEAPLSASITPVDVGTAAAIRGKPNLMQRAGRLGATRDLAGPGQAADAASRRPSRSAVASRRRSPSPVRNTTSSKDPAASARTQVLAGALVGRVANGDQRAPQPCRCRAATSSASRSSSRDSGSAMCARASNIIPAVYLGDRPALAMEKQTSLKRARTRPLRRRRYEARARLAATGSNDACPCGSGKNTRSATWPRRSRPPRRRSEAGRAGAAGLGVALFEQRRPAPPRKNSRPPWRWTRSSAGARRHRRWLGWPAGNADGAKEELGAVLS